MLRLEASRSTNGETREEHALRDSDFQIDVSVSKLLDHTVQQREDVWHVVLEAECDGPGPFRFPEPRRISESEVQPPQVWHGREDGSRLLFESEELVRTAHVASKVTPSHSHQRRLEMPIHRRYVRQLIGWDVVADAQSQSLGAYVENIVTVENAASLMEIESTGAKPSHSTNVVDFDSQILLPTSHPPWWSVGPLANTVTSFYAVVRRV